jgi:hypothetical protein
MPEREREPLIYSEVGYGKCVEHIWFCNDTPSYNPTRCHCATHVLLFIPPRDSDREWRDRDGRTHRLSSCDA